MRKVGHYSKARAIQNWHADNAEKFCDYDCLLTFLSDPADENCNCFEGQVVDPLPDGFEAYSAGCFRMVFLHAPTNVVYKVEHYDPGYEPEYSNLSEKKNYRRLMKRATAEGYIGDHIRIPVVTMYNGVIAMEYIRQHRQPPQAAVDAVRRLGISDMHRGNWLFDGNRINPIDLASGYYYQAV